MNSLIGQIKKAKEAALKLASIDGKTKNRALIYLEELIKQNKKEIIKQNKKDIEKAKASNLNESLIKRLMLDEKKLNEVIELIESVKALEDPAGKITEKTAKETMIKIVHEKIEPIERMQIPDDDAHNWMKTLEEAGFSLDEIDSMLLDCSSCTLPDPVDSWDSEGGHCSEKSKFLLKLKI